MFAQEAVRLIESHDQDESFFLYLAMQDVHEPVSAPANYIALHSDIKEIRHFDCVSDPIAVHL